MPSGRLLLLLKYNVPQVYGRTIPFIILTLSYNLLTFYLSRSHHKYIKIVPNFFGLLRWHALWDGMVRKKRGPLLEKVPCGPADATCYGSDLTLPYLGSVTATCTCGGFFN